MQTRRATTSAPVVRFPRDVWGIPALERDALVTPDALTALKAEAPEWIAEVVVERGLAEPQRVADALARAAHVPAADLTTVEPSVVQFVPESVARQYAALPLSATNRVIHIATPNPLDLDAEQALRFVAGRQVEFAYALPGALRRRLDEVYRPERSIERLVSGLGGSATVEAIEEPAAAEAATTVEAPVARLVDATIADAVRERASDIHFEPSDQGLVVRYRVDGVLSEVMRVPRSAAGAVVRRCKVVAQLDVSDPLHPHDGRAAARVDGREWNLRVSSIPVARLGEKVVIRLLDPKSGIAPLDALGLWPDELATLEALFASREGVVLVTGPTGSGKTTTLYSALDRIRASGLTVVTVEEPVEYQLPGIEQIEVSERTGLTFAAALRSVLRQDPAVVLVGEIRDLETAQTAWQAGLSGHFVLSTLQTDDAALAVARLRDIGVDAYRIAAALKGVLAQRVLRKLCARCAVPLDPSTLPVTARAPADFTRPVKLLAAKGCAQCNFKGYRGRMAIAEILTVDGAIAELIVHGAVGAELVASGRRFGMRTVWEAGLRRVWVGETSYEELVRVVGEPPATAPRVTPAAAPGAPPVIEVPSAQPPPVYPTAGPMITAEPVPAAPAVPRVLVADDDPYIRNLITAVLRAESYETAEAADGVEALEQAQLLQPAIMLLDMDMPRLDGYGVLNSLRQRLTGRAVPVIVVTARDDPATESRCIELGAEDYITKPIQPASLIARIRAVLRRVGGLPSWQRS